MSKTFRTTIARTGARTYVVVPFNPNDVWGRKHRHYVTGPIGGCSIRGLLISDGAGFVLPLGPAWRRDNGVEAGANVEVVLAPDGPGPDSLAPDVVAALDSSPYARTFFESLAPFYRKNFIRWIETAKRLETRKTRIGETVKLLEDGTVLR